VERREFNSRAIAAAASITLLPSTKVSPYKDAEYLTTLGTRVVDLRDKQGSLPLLPEVHRHLKGIENTVSSSDRRLQAAASALADKLAVVLYDAEKAELAERVGLFALILGHASHDPYHIGAAYETLCNHTKRIDAKRASQYALKGTKVSEIPTDLKAQLQARYATSLVRLREGGLAMDAIDNARGVSLSTRAGQAVVTGSAGVVLCDLGQMKEGRECLGRAVQAFQERPAIYATWLVRQVKASLRARDFDAASSEINDLARTVPLLSSTRLSKNLKDVLALSAQWSDVPEVAEAHEILRTVAPETAHR